MLRNRYLWAGAFIAILVVANIIRFIFSDWGLITVRVHEVPLGQVIKSIERQGGVAIYTNIDQTTPVTMDVIRVPLPEAMESLAANVTPPAEGGDDANPPGRQRGGPVTQWKLAFFTAPSEAGVKQEITAFQSDAAGDDTKTYSYGTPLQFITASSGGPAADPRLQTWTGLKTPAPAPAGGDASSGGSSYSVQDYLLALAQAADIWIMSPSSWDPKVSRPPETGAPIIQAVKNVVSGGRGAVTQAFVLYARTGRRGGGGRGGFGGGGDTGWANMEDRMRNAINGLPAENRAEALNQLNEQANFRKQMEAAPPDQRRAMMRQYFMDHMDAMDNWRRSPEKRAQMYQRAVSNRQAARGK